MDGWMGSSPMKIQAQANTCELMITSTAACINLRLAYGAEDGAEDVGVPPTKDAVRQALEHHYAAAAGRATPSCKAAPVKVPEAEVSSVLDWFKAADGEKKDGFASGDFKSKKGPPKKFPSHFICIVEEFMNRGTVVVGEAVVVVVVVVVVVCSM